MANVCGPSSSLTPAAPASLKCGLTGGYLPEFYIGNRKDIYPQLTLASSDSDEIAIEAISSTNLFQKISLNAGTVEATSPAATINKKLMYNTQVKITLFESSVDDIKLINQLAALTDAVIAVIRYAPAQDLLGTTVAAIEVYGLDNQGCTANPEQGGSVERTVGANVQDGAMTVITFATTSTVSKYIIKAAGVTTFVDDLAVLTDVTVPAA